jgi:hypothetical protein
MNLGATRFTVPENVVRLNQIGTRALPTVNMFNWIMRASPPAK